MPVRVTLTHSTLDGENAALIRRASQIMVIAIRTATKSRICLLQKSAPSAESVELQNLSQQPKQHHFPTVELIGSTQIHANMLTRRGIARATIASPKTSTCTTLHAVVLGV